MSGETRPILRPYIDVDSYSATSASSKSATLINDGSNHDQGATIASWLYKKYQKSSICRCFTKNPLIKKHFHRVVDRNGDFHQSNGKMAIKKKIRAEDWRALYAGDLFHSLVDAPSMRSIGILLSGYMFLVFLFSLPYYYISLSYGCDLGIDTYQESFAFSLETMATIGYGTQDIFFNDCWSPVIVLACQISCKLVADAVIIGVIYSRFGRPNTRASTIIFSNYAVIRRISGKLYFMFQLVELRKHQLIEAHVRLYVIRRDVNPPHSSELDKENIATINAASNSETDQPESLHFRCDDPVVTNFQTCKMRTSFPDDSLGGMLIMCLPQVIVHELDSTSPLMPPPLWRSCQSPDKCYRWTPRAFDADSDGAMGRRDHDALHPADALRRRHQKAPMNTRSTFPGVTQRSVPLGEKDKDRDGDGRDFDGTRTYPKYDEMAPKTPENARDRRNLAEHSKPFKAAHSPRNDDAGLNGAGSDEHLRRPLLGGLNGTDVLKGRDVVEVKGSAESSAVRGSTEPELIDSSDSYGYLEEKDMIAFYMCDRKMEIMAVVEGIDATTGGVVQARHSFIPSEVHWHKSFAPCVFEDRSDGSAIIDFSVFHDLVNVAENAPYAGPISSHT